MKRQEATAKRYAKALLAAARDAGSVEAAGQELDAASGVIFAHGELRDFLLRPWIKGEGKLAVIAAVADGTSCSAPVRNLLGLLARRGRVDHLPEIVRVYRQLVDEELGRARVEVRSAVALTESERHQLADRLGRAVGKRVLIEAAVDSTLLGGFVARIGSLVFDASLDGQLARLRERLVKG